MTFKVGDLVRCSYNNNGVDLIYVVEKNIGGRYNELSLVPVHQFFGEPSKNRRRSVYAANVNHVSLVDLGREYVRFGQFIAAVTKMASGDDEGLCSDIAARDEVAQ